MIEELSSSSGSEDSESDSGPRQASPRSARKVIRDFMRHGRNISIDPRAIHIDSKQLLKQVPCRGQPPASGQRRSLAAFCRGERRDL